MNKSMIELADFLGIRHDNLPREVLAEQVCVKALEYASELLHQLKMETVRKEAAFEEAERLGKATSELKRKVFCHFNDDECWIFQDDGHDYPESLSCPVVMSAEKLRELMKARNELAAQVERLLNYIERCSPWNTNPEKCERRLVLSETPPASLAALKAQWQAEILAEISLQVSASKPEATPMQIATAILAESKRIRQRAQEHDQ